MEDLDHLMFELEEKRKLVVVKKTRNSTMKLNRNLGALVRFVVMIDMQRLLVVINSYLNFKTYFITFI